MSEPVSGENSLLAGKIQGISLGRASEYSNWLVIEQGLQWLTMAIPYAIEQGTNVCLTGN